MEVSSKSALFLQGEEKGEGKEEKDEGKEGKDEGKEGIDLLTANIIH